VAKNVDNVRVYGDIDSAVWVAAKGTTAPTDPTTAPGAGFVELGWLGEDGMTEMREVDTDQKRAWQGAAIVRTVRTSDTRRFKFVCLETNKTTIGLTRPGSTPSTAAGVTTTSVKAYTGSDKRAWIIDQRDGSVDNRKVVPDGEVVEMGDITGQNGELVAYEVTVECYPDSSGVLYIEYSNDPAVAV
jgi:hypothetical protein